MKITRRLAFILILIVAFSSLNAFNKVLIISTSTVYLLLEWEEFCLSLRGGEHD